MTTQSPEERAEEIVRGQRRAYMNFGDQVAFVATAIREAVEAEREACAEAAAEPHEDDDTFDKQVRLQSANAIRSRSEKP